MLKVLLFSVFISFMSGYQFHLVLRDGIKASPINWLGLAATVAILAMIFSFLPLLVPPC